MARRNVASAVAAARPARASSNGGTAAPARAAKGPTTGLGNNTAINPNHPNYVPRGTAKPQAPASSPVPAAAPAPAPLPWDARAQADVGAAQTKYGNTIAELAGGWAGREGYYGFGENGANNPYSQAALLATHHEWSERGVLNGANNQLYAGATVNAHRQEEGRYSTSYNQLLQAYESERAAKVRQEEAARRERESEEEAARLAAIERAQEAPPEPAPPAPAPAPSAPSYAPGSPGNKKNTKKSGISNNRKAK